MRIRDGKSDIFPNIVCEIELQKDTIEIAINSHKIEIPFNNLEKLSQLETLDTESTQQKEDKFATKKINGHFPKWQT